MQLGLSCLTLEERQHCLKESQCIYCALKGHFLASCPVKTAGSPVRKRTQVNQTQAVPSSPCPLTQAELLLDSKCHKRQVLTDSRVDKSFVDWSLAKELGILTEPLPVTREVNVLDGCLYQVTH